jgi:hypothetical protein
VVADPEEAYASVIHTECTQAACRYIAISHPIYTEIFNLSSGPSKTVKVGDSEIPQRLIFKHCVSIGIFH